MTLFAPNLYRYKIKSGVRYATRVQIGGKQIWQKGFLTATQAKSYLLEVQVGRVDAKYFPERIPAPTLTEYVGTWLSACTLRGLRRNTLRSYKQNLHDHVLPRLGGYTMDAITRQDVIGLLRQKQSEEYSGNSIRLMIAPLSRLMSDAIDEGIIEHNPCLRPGRILQLRKRKREPVALTPVERDALLSAYLIHRPEFYPLTATLFLSGVRIGEAMAFERTDPDLAHATLLVRRTYGRGHLEESTKNRRFRRIELDQPLVQILARHLERLQTIDPKGVLLFPNTEGHYLHERNWQRRIWEPMLVRAGIRRVTPHCTRHTYATEMLNQGRPLPWVSAQLGHSSIQITVDTYGHMSQRNEHQPRKEELQHALDHR